MTPILNPPEAALLAIGSIRKEPVVDENDRVVIRPMAVLSLTIDHSVLDGFPAARFLASVKKLIQSPETVIAE